MRLITILKQTATYELGKAVVNGKFEPINEEVTFLEWLEELAHQTPEFGKGVKGGKRMRKIARKIDEAETAETITLEDADWSDMKKKLDAMEYAPAKAEAVLDFMEEFEKATEHSGTAGA